MTLLVPIGPACLLSCARGRTDSFDLGDCAQDFLQMAFNNEVFAHWFLGSFYFKVKVQPN